MDPVLQLRYNVAIKNKFSQLDELPQECWNLDVHLLRDP